MTMPALWTVPHLIGINRWQRRVHIGVFDDGPREDAVAHHRYLLHKIDGYIQYVRSGALIADYPHARGFSVVFEFIATGEQTTALATFWRGRQSSVTAMGFAAVHRTIDVRQWHRAAPCPSDAIGTATSGAAPEMPVLKLHTGPPAAVA